MSYSVKVLIATGIFIYVVWFAVLVATMIRFIDPGNRFSSSYWASVFDSSTVNARFSALIGLLTMIIGAVFAINYIAELL